MTRLWGTDSRGKIKLLCAYLRPSDIDGARHAAAILKPLVRRLRTQWPGVRNVLRDDSAFCRQRVLSGCERAGAHDIVGLARKARLQAQVGFAELWMQDAYKRPGRQQRRVDGFDHAAQRWPRERRVINGLEWGEQGCNRRFY